MARTGQAGITISPAGKKLAQEILVAYPQGLFPMADRADDPEIAWYRPNLRGTIPLDGFHMSKSLRRFARQNIDDLEWRWDSNFMGVISACAARETTWINDTIKDAFFLLHQHGLAHSFEVYHRGALMGGVYGLALQGAFFGESMFSNQTNGSKLALAAMVFELRALGFTLYDTQFLTDHLASLGAVEISADEYQRKLERALAVEPKGIQRGDVPARGLFFK